MLTTIRAAKPPAPVLRELRAVSSLPSVLQDRLVWWSLIGAVLVTLAGVVSTGAVPDLAGRMGAPTWSDSWGSNATVGAALVAALAGLASFPDYTRYMHRSSYTILNVLFPAIVGLAPVLYGLFRTATKVTRDGRQETQYQGFAGAFLVTSSLTLWGAFGQLSTLFFVVLELEHALALPERAATILLVLAAVLGIVLVIYAITSIAKLITRPAVQAGADSTGAPPALPDWPLL